MRIRTVIGLLVLAVSIVLPVNPAPAASGIACIGAPAADPGAAGLGSGLYLEKRVFIEAQSWWPDRGSHAHLGACVPADQTISGPLLFNWQLQFHDFDGYASKMYQQVSTNPSSSAGETMTFANSDSSKFAGSDTVHWFSSTFDPAAASPVSGWQAVKSRLEIKVADGKVRPAIRFMAYLDNGRTRDDYSRSWTDAYGWQTDPAYAHAILYPASKSPYSATVPMQPVSGRYTFRARHESTTDGVSNNVTSWEVSIDPALHAAVPTLGNVIGSGATTCPVGKGICQGPTSTFTVDTTTMTNGVHWIAIFTHCTVDASHENTGVLKFPILVSNP